jgi:hypothetical protein
MHHPTCGIEAHYSGFPQKHIGICPSEDVIVRTDDHLIFDCRKRSQTANKAFEDVHNSTHGLENERQSSNPFHGFPIAIEPHDNDPFGYYQLTGEQLAISFCCDREDGCHFWGNMMRGVRTTILILKLMLTS